MNMPKSIVQLNRELKEYRESLGLVLCQLWVSPAKRDQLKKDYPLPKLDKK